MMTSSTTSVSRLQPIMAANHRPYSHQVCQELSVIVAINPYSAALRRGEGCSVFFSALISAMTAEARAIGLVR